MCALSEAPLLLVAGIGNRYRTDDAVGLRLVGEWGGQGAAGVETQLWEEMDGMTIAEQLLAYARPVLIVDCAEMGLAGGETRLLRGESLTGCRCRGVVSSHGLGLAEALPLATALGHAQPLWVLGVQPFAIAMGAELSPPMAMALPGLVRELAAAVGEIVKELAPG